MGITTTLMTWQKPELIQDREAIADAVLFPNWKRYCCRTIAWWICAFLFDIPFMSIFESEPPKKCGYCYHCVDDSERMLMMEEQESMRC